MDHRHHYLQKQVMESCPSWYQVWRVATVLSGAHLVAGDGMVEGVDDLHFTGHSVEVTGVKLPIFLYHHHWAVRTLSAHNLRRQQQQQHEPKRRVCGFPAAGHAASFCFISTLTDQPERSSGEGSNPRGTSDDVWWRNHSGSEIRFEKQHGKQNNKYSTKKKVFFFLNHRKNIKQCITWHSLIS